MSRIKIYKTQEPESPSQGSLYVYADKEDNHLKTKDSSGNVIDLSVGSASDFKALVSDSANLVVTTGTSTILFSPSATPTYSSASITNSLTVSGVPVMTVGIHGITVSGVSETTGPVVNFVGAGGGNVSILDDTIIFHAGTGGGGGGSTPPGGLNTYVQFNDGGVFGGDAGLIYSKSTDTLTCVVYSGTTGQFGGALSSQSLSVSNTASANTLSAITGSFTGTVSATTITGTSVQAGGALSSQSLLVSNTAIANTFSGTVVSAPTITGTTGQFGGALSSQSLSVSNTASANTFSGAIGSFTSTISAPTITGTNIQVGQTVSAQNGTFSTSLTISGTPVSLHHIFQIAADQLDSVGTGWDFTDTSAVALDSNNGNLAVRLFDDTLSEGAGCILAVPKGTSKMTLNLKHRAETAPATPKTIELIVSSFKVPNNTSVPGWGSNVILTLSIPTNENWQYFGETHTLTEWGMTAGDVYQIEFTRSPGAPADLVGDWVLLLVELEFR